MRWALAGLGLVAGLASAAEWPGYLGPTRDGRSAETGIAEGWKRGTKVLWRAPIGPGYAGVAVSGGTVFAMAARDAQDQLVALDAVTGAERWRAKVGAFYEDGMNYDGPRSTPTVAGDRVVALGGYGTLAAFDRTSGRPLWSVELVSGLGGAMPQWGFSGSPLVSDGKVYVTTGGTQGNGLVALSLADGSVVWKTGSFEAGYSSPIRATLAGRDQVVFFTGFGAVGAEPATGEVLWKYPWPTNYEVNAATPLVVGGRRLFIASAYGVGGAMLEVGADGKVTELWRTKKMKNKTATAVLVDGNLYGFNESALTALDAVTGEERWYADGYGRGTLIAADGHLVVLSESCALSLVQATPAAHRPVGSPQPVLSASPCWTAPSLADGVVYVRDGKELAAVEVRPFGPAPVAP